MLDIIVFAVIVYYIYKVAIKNKQNKAPINGNYSNLVAVTMNEPAVKAVIDEAIKVINDMLSVGNGASYCSVVEYAGMITAFPVHGNDGQYRIFVAMNNVSELQGCGNRYPKARQNSANAEMFRVYDSFASRYKKYYDYAHCAYIYKTTNTVAPKGGEEALNSLLFEQVRLRCPNANITGNNIKDKKFCY